MLTAKDRAAWLTAAYFAALFAAFGAQLPYWPVWLQAWGLSEAQVGWYLGAAMIARIIGTSLLPALADRYAVRRALITVTAAMAALAHLAHLWIDTPALLMAATLVAAVVMAPAAPLGDALALTASGRHGFAYAPVRAAGSAAFLAANVGIGLLIGRLGPDLALWVVVAGFTLVALLGAVHPGGGAPADRDRRTTAPEMLRLLGTPVFLIFALAASMGQASHAVYYAYSVLDWRAQGIADGTIGWLWAFGVLVETVLFLTVGRRWIVALGPVGALSLAAIAGTLRWAAMALTPGLALLWPLQALHGLTFAIGYLGAMAFLAAALPDRLIATANGLKSGLLGGGLNAAVLFLAGALVAVEGIATAYWLAMFASAISLGLTVVLGRQWRGGPLSVS